MRNILLGKRDTERSEDRSTQKCSAALVSLRWILTDRSRRKIPVIEVRCLRKIAEITRRNRIRNKIIIEN